MDEKHVVEVAVGAAFTVQELEGGRWRVGIEFEDEDGDGVFSDEVDGAWVLFPDRRTAFLMVIALADELGGR